MWEKLKERWKLKNNWSVLVVIILFAITGSTSVRIAEPLLDFIGVTDSMNPWLYWPIRILIVFPIYQVLFLCFGFLLGQWQFAWMFEKKMLSRFGIKL